MYYSPSLDRLYASYVAGWWFGMMMSLHWWAGLSATAETTPAPKQHLRLVTDRGRLVEHK